ncbi:MAG: TrkA family potassium uptake protein [Armatimonadota bacterium]
MFIIIVGGGKVGYYLLKDLLEAGQEVSIIEKNKQKADSLSEVLGGIVINGDGCDPLVLERSGAERADMVVAITGDDEDNLVICQVTKSKFNVPFVLAQVNNPKNESIFKILGIDATISSTNLLLSLIEQEVAHKGIFTSLPIYKKAGVQIVEALITPKSSLNNKTVKDLTLPPHTLITGVIRDENWLIPDGNFVIKANDMVICIIKEENYDQMKKMLINE